MTEPSKEQIEAWHDDATLGTKTLDLPHFARAAYAAGRRAGMEEAAKICEGIVKECGGVVVGPFATDFGKVIHEAQAVGALNSASAIRAAMEADDE